MSWVQAWIEMAPSISLISSIRDVEPSCSEPNSLITLASTMFKQIHRIWCLAPMLRQCFCCEYKIIYWSDSPARMKWMTVPVNEIIWLKRKKQTQTPWKISSVPDVGGKLSPRGTVGLLVNRTSFLLADQNKTKYKTSAWERVIELMYLVQKEEGAEPATIRSHGYTE